MPTFIQSWIKSCFCPRIRWLGSASCSSWSISGPCIPTKSLKPLGYFWKKKKKKESHSLMLWLSHCKTRSEETKGKIISLWIAILHPRPATILQMVASVECGGYIQKSSALSRKYVFLPSSHQSLQMKPEQDQAAKKVSEQSGCDEHIYDPKDTVKVELMFYPLSHRHWILLGQTEGISPTFCKLNPLMQKNTGQGKRKVCSSNEISGEVQFFTTQRAS